MKRARLMIIAVLIGTCVAFSTAFAVEAKKNTKVLDFEADLIEGERMAPNIFTEIEPHRPGLDLILYQRNNFNDFHSIERGRRPKYISGRALPRTARGNSRGPNQAPGRNPNPTATPSKFPLGKGK